MPRSNLRRWSLRLVVLAGYADWRHFGQPEPIPVGVAEVDLGRVEATAANTRAGTVKACRRRAFRRRRRST